MKAILLFSLSAAVIATFSACESDGENDHDHDRGGRTVTTTTEETTLARPVSATTETQTIRSY